ncbi:MAG: recombinase family protein [Ruminococcus sp.]|jgi:DNA invertase Pin-like site-specific DNA recombinase|nr:recombinase family protein [Ruminococcus sp.]
MARIRKALQVSVDKQWKVALYLRLSREDGNDESLSVGNQRKILTDYLRNNWNDEDYKIVDTYIDDGLTGTDTNRENFMRMKQDIIDGKVTCVIVKSLARAFRNLADQQKFLEEFLPIYSVRFINLGSPFIDTYKNPNAVSGFEVPIRGMFNEQFAAATSEEIRKTFNMKRKRGEFIGAFAPYGYIKDPDNKNKLLIDEEAAAVVRDIFRWFLYENMSINGIAKELNERGVASPIEYKKQKGLKYQNPNNRFKSNLWSTTTISSMLKNRMYIGCMVQGKQRVISYKIHKQVLTPESEWFVKEGTHEAIIELQMFEDVQARLLRDTRTAPGKKTLHLFSGFLKCLDCGRALHRRGNAGHSYYYCRLGKQSEKNCPPRSIREDVLTEVVLKSIQAQIALIKNLHEVIENTENAPVSTKKTEQLETALKKREQEIARLTKISDSIYDDWKNGDITKEEYTRLKSDYRGRIEDIRTAAEKLQTEIAMQTSGQTTDNAHFEEFLKYRNITTLTHEVLVDLVDVISLHSDGSVEIKFRFSEQNIFS